MSSPLLKLDVAIDRVCRPFVGPSHSATSPVGIILPFFGMSVFVVTRCLISIGGIVDPDARNILTTLTGVHVLPLVVLLIYFFVARAKLPTAEIPTGSLLHKLFSCTRPFAIPIIAFIEVLTYRIVKVSGDPVALAMVDSVVFWSTSSIMCILMWSYWATPSYLRSPASSPGG